MKREDSEYEQSKVERGSGVLRQGKVSVKKNSVKSRKNDRMKYESRERVEGLKCEMYRVLPKGVARVN